ncbi:uncharacterized protein LOC100897673 [Galendromus occidentalis]|uniref:Uncharacterized protein LOC100897673 n=1 Tax=Galendromus occidentalis TaxID=34638 RepID=A0AAJ6QPS8_9ACAR|nr:uncharacterized protein LOC100897673 [Galendromus occidentalis]
MRLWTIALAIESFAASTGQVFYDALPPGSIPGMGSPGYPFYQAQAPFHPNAKFYGGSQIPVSYYQNLLASLKNYQSPSPAKLYTSPLPQNANSVIDQERTPRKPTVGPSKPPGKPDVVVVQESLPDAAALQATLQLPLERQEELHILTASSDDRERESQEIAVQPADVENSASGVRVVKFDDVRHTCRAVKVCVPQVARKSRPGKPQVPHASAMNQSGPSGMKPIYLSATEAPFRIFQLADPKKRIVFQPTKAEEPTTAANFDDELWR